MQGTAHLPPAPSVIRGCLQGAGIVVPPPVPHPVPPPPPPGLDASQMQAMLSYQQLMQQQSLLALQYTLQAAQAYDHSIAHTIEPEVTELAHHFKLDERITRDLDQQLKKRSATFDDDIRAIWEILEGARNPAGLLRVKIREMEEGTFRGTATPDRDVEEMAKRFGLDAQASAKLAEVLGKRDDRKKDLRLIGKHLELSNKPSALVMLMLKDLRAGINIKEPEYPAAVGSYAHKRGLKRGDKRSRSRSRTRRRKRSSSSSSRGKRRSRSRSRCHGSSGAGPLPGGVPLDAGPRPQTLLERFG